MATIESMLGIGNLTDDEQMKVMANSLRGKKDAADILSMSTLKPVARSAAAEQGNVVDAANRGGALRAVRQRDLLDADRDAESNRTSALNKALEVQSRNQQKQLDRENAMRIARLKKNGDGTDKKPPMSGMSAATKKKYLAAEEIVSGFPDLIKRIEANPNAFGLGASFTTLLPDFTPNVLSKPAKALENSMLTDDEQMIRNDVFKNAYDIIHALAGATLAAGEEDKISKFAPMPEDDDNVIANKLKSAMAEAGRSQAIMSRLTGNEQELSSSVPEGIDPDEFNALSAEDQAYLRENM